MTGLASATPDSGRRSGSAQAWFVFALIVVVIVGVVVIGGKDDGKPYDLDSAGVSGYKGMRLTLERLGAHIDRIDATDVGGPATAHANAVFVPVADGAPHELVRRLERFARSGGVVVLGSETRASSGAIGASGSSGVDIVGEPRGRCDIGRLTGSGVVDPVGVEPIEVPDGSRSCYGSGLEALVTSRLVGSGDWVTFASPELFTNDAIRPRTEEIDDPPGPMPDNVVVLARMLLRIDRPRVAVVTSGIRASVLQGDQSLVELIPIGVKLGIWQVFCAVALYAWWRARRLGRVVAEAQPVPIAGSELVAAVGNLMERREDPGHAADLLRGETRRALTERLGVPRGTDARTLALLVAARTGRDADAVRATLAERPVDSDDALLDVAAQLESIRQEVFGV